ncbi:hypothetical protein Q7P35_005560 [Cladosporium inversicolor]
MLPTPEHAATIHSNNYNHSKKLLSAHEVAAWQMDNEFIKSAYRPASFSARKSFASLFQKHNQTVNACSHLVGASIFGGLPFVFYHNDYVNHPSSQTKDLVVISLYCFGVAVCFTFSAMQVWSKKATLPSLVQISLTSRSFHILADHSRAVSKLWNQLDYIGILILMWAAGIATIFYGFLCNERLQLIYTSTFTSSALFCVFVTLTSHFDSPQFRSWRAVLYATFGLSFVVFVIHGLVLYGWEEQQHRMSLESMIWMTVIPERWAPYTFDILGASHQILHIAVVGAAWIHYLALLESFHDARDDKRPCSLPGDQR